ncbi:MAG: hypothetical protein R3246_13690, partial [Acidimicrobiia bacterium]|nr:hypothetical protein [Acidimicrobiia bacterium]
MLFYPTIVGLPTDDYYHDFSEDYWCGADGVHKDSHAYTAPTDGTLTARIDDLVGDWDLWLTDPDGGGLGAGGWADQLAGDANHEQVVAHVQAGQIIHIVACNWASPQTQIEVSYSFQGDALPTEPLPSGAFDHITPGGGAALSEEVPVNVVFAGFDEEEVSSAAFLEAMPQRYRPIIRSRSWYGHQEYVGIDHTFDYNLVFAGQEYEDALFTKLLELARPAQRTSLQHAYNESASGVLDIDSNVEIPATAVERWLATHPPDGIDTTQNTVFFINWFGRSDFRFHVYTKLGERDPASGIDHGLNDALKTVAWGGTPADDPEDGLGFTARVWFYDLSAGPDQFTGSWDVDADREDYRIPPIWEYGADGYRAKGTLTSDLARITR